MQRRNITDLIKNAVGTVFLLAGAFFVCSTLLSMRAVFADPIAPAITATATTTASPRATNSRNIAPSRGTTATTATSRPSMANRTTNATSRTNTASRGVAARTATSRGTATTTASRANASIASRSVGARGTATRTGAATNTNTTASRGVTARTGTTARVAANNSARTVAARASTTATNAGASRVSLQGSAIRGTTSTTYQYLKNKLYTGNYSNIIDSTTGMISAEAFNNCMESYYTCMDEICTARNQAQRRCACAGRVKAFATAETQLETANEELIKVSGELALLIATKGKDVSAALQLTDAEKVMNCVSWQETTNEHGQSSAEAIAWCESHGIFGQNGGKPASCPKPSYCTAGGNDFGFDVSTLTGGGSDILASLQSFASAKENTLTILDSDDNKLSNAFSQLTSVINNSAGLNTTLSTDLDLKDSLSQTWGYELFEYAHNNVCNRVLDSCFNGIYEACGQPTGSSKKQRVCGNGQVQCPFNYSSYISVDKSNGEYTLDFISDNKSYSHSVSNSATCFGYTSADGDPYNALRGPVADARRSIMQKYALDANADCDVYGEQLRTQAQNISYQKVAAQQALQQKRLEFAQEEDAANESALAAAKQNYLNCLDEIYDCYDTVERTYKSQGWSNTRMKSYCNTMSNVPSCYEQMICEQGATQIITETDVKNDRTGKLVQNVVTLSDILSLGVSGDDKTSRAACLNNDMNVDSIRSFGLYQNTRENCIPTGGVTGYREYINNAWTDCVATECKPGYYLNTANGKTTCELNANMHPDSGAKTVGIFVPIVGFRCDNGYVATSQGGCVLAECDKDADYDISCLVPDANGTIGGCYKTACRCDKQTIADSGQCGACDNDKNMHLEGGACVKNTRDCTDGNGYGTQTWNYQWGACVLERCNSGYHLTNTKECVPNKEDCTNTGDAPAGALRAEKTWADNVWGLCVATQCDVSSNYILTGGTCTQCANDEYATQDNQCVKQKTIEPAK